MLNIPNEAIRRLLAPYGVDAQDSLCERIRTYTILLLRWSRKVALTTITEPSEIVRFHFGESLCAISVLPPLRGRLADIGSGAGFPGLPLKLSSLETHVTLIEPNTKKVAFLWEVIRELNLDGMDVFHGRAEDMPSEFLPFNFVTTRALGFYPRILKWASYRLFPEGVIAFWLGGKNATAIAREKDWNWMNPALIPGTRNRYILAGKIPQNR